MDRRIGWTDGRAGVSRGRPGRKSTRRTTAWRSIQRFDVAASPARYSADVIVEATASIDGALIHSYRPHYRHRHHRRQQQQQSHRYDMTT